MTARQPLDTYSGVVDVLVYCPSTQEQFVAFRSNGEWQYAVDRHGECIVCEPSHWQPLPKPPETKRSAA